LPPIFEGQLVGLVYEEDVSLASPTLLGLVYRDELHEVPEEDVCGLALVVKVDVVDFLLSSISKKSRMTEARIAGKVFRAMVITDPAFSLRWHSSTRAVSME